jgi:hypothetical protein
LSDAATGQMFEVDFSIRRYRARFSKESDLPR